MLTHVSQVTLQWAKPTNAMDIATISFATKIFDEPLQPSESLQISTQPRTLESVSLKRHKRDKGSISPMSNSRKISVFLTENFIA